MNWRTKEQAEKAGKGTQLEAAECSLKRWEQGATCTYEELRDGMLSGEAVFADGSPDRCALCYYYAKKVGPCLRGEDCCRGCCGEYYKAREAFDNFICDTSRHNCDLFQTKAKALCAVIKKFMDGLEPKQELKHWDYGVEGTTGFICIQSNIRDKLEYANVFGLVQERKLSQPIVMGNLEDLLARNAEDLRGFKVSANCVKSGFKAEIVEYGKCIEIGTTVDTWNFNLSKAQEIHQKLGQLIATALRGERKGK